jgi:uncharacterized protein (DUF433 family)
VPRLTRITRDHRTIGGKPCIRGMRVTVGTIVGLRAQGHGRAAVLEAYPYLEPEDLREALAYACGTGDGSGGGDWRTLIRAAFRERGFFRITISTSKSTAVNKFISRSREKPASL